MGNCLVTKLKDVVNNDNLRKLGEVRFTMMEENPVFSNNLNLSTQHVYIEFSVPTKVTAISGNFVSHDGLTNRGTVYEGTTFDESITEGGVVSIENKYAITSIRFPRAGAGLEFNLDDLQYSDNLSSLEINRGLYTFGDISALADKLSLSSISLQLASNIKGNISSLNTLSALTSISLRNCVGIIGDASSATWLGNVTTLDFLSIPEVTCDISLARNAIRIFINHGKWLNSRGSDKTIPNIGTTNVKTNMGTSLDAMLTDLANCLVPASATSIYVTGTPSVSDAHTAELATALKTHAGNNLTLVVNGTSY